MLQFEVQCTHLAFIGDEVEAVDALVAVVGLRVRGSWRRFVMPASLVPVPVNDELDLPYLELLEKLCFMEFDVDLNILARLPAARALKWSREFPDRRLCENLCTATRPSACSLQPGIGSWMVNAAADLEEVRRRLKLSWMVAGGGWGWRCFIMGVCRPTSGTRLGGGGNERPRINGSSAEK